MSSKKKTTPPSPSISKNPSNKTIPLAADHSTVVQESNPMPPLYVLGGIFLTLSLAIWAIYGGSFGHDFVDWDDYEYVKENVYVLQPAWQNIALFFKSAYFGNYHPLTMLSYMTSSALVGKEAGDFIKINVLLHIINAFLVYYFAYRLSGRSLWIGVFTALFFAIHPLHVESVVWVSERKDVLYTLFFISSCIAYLFYTDKKQSIWYISTFLLFLLSCLSKPAAIVLPLVLILLDDWQQRPLGQIKIWLEKIPFFLLSLLFGSIAMSIQDGGNFFGLFPTISAQSFAISDLDIGFWQHCQDAGYGFVTYLYRLFLPHGLAAYHPYPNTHPPVFNVYPILAVLLLGATVYSRKYSKALFFGVGFYLVTIILVLQFISVGSAIIAERYTYVPYIGLLFALFYTLDRLIKQRPTWFYPISGLFIAIAIIFIVQSRNYTNTWKNTITLWDNVIQHYPDIAKPYTLRGTFKGKSGDLAAAVKDFEHSLTLDTMYAATYEGLGNVYGIQQQPQKALDMFEKALKYDPNNGKSYYNRALARIQLQQYDLIMTDLDRALELSPNRAADIHALRGYTHLRLQQYKAAIDAYSQAIQVRPNANAYCYRGFAYMNIGDKENARADLQQSLKLDPKLVEAEKYLLQLDN